ncbi:MAG: hypothetical protein U5M51_02455 [Emticicia sp.]|nr:hypothetical protein [Emticicia sp.]
MKKDTISLIFEESKDTFLSKGFKIKKNPQGGIIFNLEKENLFLKGGFGFFDDSYPSILYMGTIQFFIKLFEVENIYEIFFEKHSCSLINNSSTVGYSDIEWQDSHTFNIMNSLDNISLRNYTKEVLTRFETFILPLIEKYQSIHELAELFRNDPQQFKRIVTDNRNMKYLLILKLAKSDLFEKEYQIKDEFLKSLLNENNSNVELKAFYNVFKEIGKL